MHADDGAVKSLAAQFSDFDLVKILDLIARVDRMMKKR